MTRISVPVQLRWADMDAYGHVNNAQMLQLLEEARIETFWAHPGAPSDAVRPTAVIDAGPGARTTTLVAHQEIEYLRPLGYRRTPVEVQLWIGQLGGASVDVCYEVVDTGTGTGPGTTAAPTVYARASTTLVLVDTASGAPRRLSEVERAAWTPFLGPAIQFRRRRPVDPA